MPSDFQSRDNGGLPAVVLTMAAPGGDSELGGTALPPGGPR